MGMKHPEPTFAALVARIREAYPRFAYLHVVEPRVNKIWDFDDKDKVLRLTKMTFFATARARIQV